MPSTPRTWPVLLLLSIACAAVGSWFLVGQRVSLADGVVLPEALGVPFGLPPLRAWPLGQTYWLIWVADTLAALLLVVVVWRRLATSNPDRLVGRFLTAWWALPAGLMLANLVRLLAWSEAESASFATWITAAVASMLLSLVAGLVIGLPLGVVHALLGRKRPRGANSTAAGDLPARGLYDDLRAPEVG